MFHAGSVKSSTVAALKGTHAARTHYSSIVLVCASQIYRSKVKAAPQLEESFRFLSEIVSEWILTGTVLQTFCCTLTLADRVPIHIRRRKEATKHIRSLLLFR